MMIGDHYAKEMELEREKEEAIKAAKWLAEYEKRCAEKQKQRRLVELEEERKRKEIELKKKKAEDEKKQSW